MVYSFCGVIKMKLHIKEFAGLCGVSVRTLHYYDEIGLLKPACVDKSTGYRFYDENSLLRMQEILFYRELDFSLKSIGEFLSSPEYNKQKALAEQKKLLVLKKQRLERLISAIDDAAKGATVMKKFDNSEFENYKQEVKERWGSTDAYKEYSQKVKGYSKEKKNDLESEMNDIFCEFSMCMKNNIQVNSDQVLNLVSVLQNHITENYYRCTNEILTGLGQMYVYDERFRNNIDKNGDGTAEYVRNAIEVYCRK